MARSWKTSNVVIWNEAGKPEAITARASALGLALACGPLGEKTKRDGWKQSAK